MKGVRINHVVALLVCVMISGSTIMVRAEDPTIRQIWNITYGTISPLGVPQEVILINGQFPGPVMNCTTNTVWEINVHNNIDEPFLLHLNGIQQRKDTWDDGTTGTQCPIQPGTNYTLKFQLKDQIGSYFYAPFHGMQRASGAIGGINLISRIGVPVPFDAPAGDFNVLIGDWYTKGHKTLARRLDSGRSIARPDAIHINGQFNKVGEVAKPMFTMTPGKTYRYRICNVGMKDSLNFRIQGHPMKLVEVEGAHTVQNVYDSLDVHVGQCMSVLVTADKEAKDYYMVASSRFTRHQLQSVALIHYENGIAPASLELPPPPPVGTRGVAWSINQFRSLRWNLTASAARPNPQGSYKYGSINITRTLQLANTKAFVNGKLRYGINGVSHVDPDTPVKLAEYFGIANKTFTYNVMADVPPTDKTNFTVAPNVLQVTHKTFIEIIFENHENTIQTWNLDGHSFFAVAIEPGTWTPEKRKTYNLVDALYRHNVQVYPKSWAAILIAYDNAGMWNLRSENWERTYLGQQLYTSLVSEEKAVRDEKNPREDILLCGAVVGLPRPLPYKDFDAIAAYWMNIEEGGAPTPYPVHQ